jgi:hypothetical protein
MTLNRISCDLHLVVLPVRVNILSHFICYAVRELLLIMFCLCLENGGKLGHTNPSRDRLVYVMTQFIGHHVDVHVKNGSIVSGIFHATNTDKDFGTESLSLCSSIYPCAFKKPF